MLARLLLILAGLGVGPAAGAVGGGAEDCSICKSECKLPCDRCKGHGKRSINCLRCSGKRKLDCPANLCIDGLRWCHACEGEGKIHWNSGGTDPCKVCKRKGKLKCPFCKGSKTLGCPDCGKTGKIKVGCAACLGMGSHPCPRASCRDQACPLCSDSKEVGCYICQEDGQHEGRCKHCAGHGTRFCPEKFCAAGMLVCKKCFGTGTEKRVYRNGSSAGSKRCGQCRGKGFDKCKTCKGGTIPCKEQVPSEDCKSCDRGKVTCARCR